eukprot:SAG31_NODE_851_length_11519_cov_4.727145_12_plen_383_part_00
MQCYWFQSQQFGSTGLRIYVKSTQEWALEDLGAVVTATSSREVCPGNVHNLLMQNPVHTCQGECSSVDDCEGDPRFMFGTGDNDQTITIDLGQSRKLNRIGAEYSIGDREVWDHVRFEVSDDDQNWYDFGIIGSDDDVPDISSATAWVTSSEAVNVRYIKYHFGEGSVDHGGVGSGIDRLHAVQVGSDVVRHAWPEPLVAVDVDEDTGAVVLSGTSAASGTVLTEQGSPDRVAGPSGAVDALAFDTGDMLLLEPSVDTDATWTIDCWIRAPLRGNSNWGTLTRGQGGDHQVITNQDDDGGGNLGGYDNSAARFIDSGFDMDSLSAGWHRLTVATLCADDGCASRGTVYFIDGQEVTRTSYSSETDFYAIGNYQGGSQPVSVS